MPASRLVLRHHHSRPQTTRLGSGARLLAGRGGVRVRRCDRRQKSKACTPLSLLLLLLFAKNHFAKKLDVGVIELIIRPAPFAVVGVVRRPFISSDAVMLHGDCSARMRHGGMGGVLEYANHGIRDAALQPKRQVRGKKVTHPFSPQPWLCSRSPWRRRLPCAFRPPAAHLAASALRQLLQPQPPRRITAAQRDCARPST